MGDCGCKKTAVVKYTWTSGDGNQVVRNLNEVQAKTRVNSKGGTYVRQ